MTRARCLALATIAALALGTGCAVTVDYDDSRLRCDDGVCPSTFACDRKTARCLADPPPPCGGASLFATDFSAPPRWMTLGTNSMVAGGKLRLVMPAGMPGAEPYAASRLPIDAIDLTQAPLVIEGVTDPGDGASVQLQLDGPGSSMSLRIGGAGTDRTVRFRRGDTILAERVLTPNGLWDIRFVAQRGRSNEISVDYAVAGTAAWQPLATDEPTSFDLRYTSMVLQATNTSMAAVEATIDGLSAPISQSACEPTRYADDFLQATIDPQWALFQRDPQSTCVMDLDQGSIVIRPDPAASVFPQSCGLGVRAILDLRRSILGLVVGDVSDGAQVAIRLDSDEIGFGGGVERLGTLLTLFTEVGSECGSPCISRAVPSPVPPWLGVTVTEIGPGTTKLRLLGAASVSAADRGEFEELYGEPRTESAELGGLVVRVFLPSATSSVRIDQVTVHRGE